MATDRTYAREAWAGLIPALEGKPTLIFSDSPVWEAAQLVAVASQLIEDYALTVKVETRNDASGRAGASFEPVVPIKEMGREQLRTMLASSGAWSLAELSDVSDDELREFVASR